MSAKPPFDALSAQKELLMLKAEMQRMELGYQVQDLKREVGSLPSLNTVRKVWTWATFRSMGPMGQIIGPVLKSVLGSYPLLSAMASAALVRYRKPISGLGAKAGLAAVALAAGLYWIKGRSMTAPASTNPNASKVR